MLGRSSHSMDVATTQTGLSDGWWKELMLGNKHTHNHKPQQPVDPRDDWLHKDDIWREILSYLQPPSSDMSMHKAVNTL